jgi:serine/threonine-protein kinase
MAGVGAIVAAQIAGSHRERPSPSPAASTIAPTAPAVPSSAAIAPLPEGPQERTVRVVVLPPEAHAQVDGIDAPVLGGVVPITGTVGSVHRVRLSVGRRETVVEVRIAEEGPVPPKAEIEMPPARGGAGATPASPPPAAPPRPVTPPPPASPPAATATGGMHMEMK